MVLASLPLLVLSRWVHPVETTVLCRLHYVVGIISAETLSYHESNQAAFAYILHIKVCTSPVRRHVQFRKLNRVDLHER